MAQLDLTLLGGFRAWLNTGPPLTLPARKAQALLAFLGFRPGEAQPRDKLAALLWGDMPQPQARASLRQALTTIRRALGGTDVLRVDADTVALDHDVVTVDVLTFQQKVKVGTREALEEATSLYQGDLLAGLTLNEAPFEEWLLAERERLRELAVEAFARLLTIQRAAGAPEAAVESALRLLGLDPLQEPAHRTLMRLYAQLGRRGAALRQYQVCVAALERELHTEPEPETKALYQEILRGPADAPKPKREPLKQQAVTPPPRLPAPAPEIPLVGRHAELTILEDSLTRSRAGKGELVALLGEAGIGKSRVAEEISAIATTRSYHVISGRCYETEQALPFAPWIDALRAARVTDRDGPVAGLAPVWRAELTRILPEVGDGAPAVRSDADPRNLFEAILQLLEHLAGERPLLATFEDLHWADEMSLRLIAFAGRRLPGRRVMILVTARDEEIGRAPLLGQTLAELERDGRLVRVPLAPLSRAETTALTSRVVAGARAPANDEAIEEEVWRASEGNPFVAVETARALSRTLSVGSDHRAPLPGRVHDLIARRLAQLGESSRQLVAIAAVVGRQCDFALLQQAAELPELDAARAMEDLVRQRVLHQSGEGFEFTHDRVREVARSQLLPPHQLILHRRIATSLEALGTDPRGADALAIGTHYQAGQMWAKAAHYLSEAGHAAWARLAKTDAAGCFEQALDCLRRLSETHDRTDLAFEVSFALARVRFSIGDFAGALHHYRAAEGLARTLGDDRRLSQVLGGMLYLLSSEALHAEATEAGERALALARTVGDRTLQAWTGIGLGRAYFALGQYRLGIQATEWLVALDAQSPLDATARPATLLPSVGSRTWMALSLTRIGDYGGAFRLAEDAVAAAERADNAQARVWAYYTLAYIHLSRAEPDRAATLLDHALPLCRNGQLPLYFPRVLGARGYAHALGDRATEAVELLEQAVAESRSIRLLYGHAGLVTWLGVAYLGAGRVEDAERLAADAVALTRERGERGDEGWALRLAAEAAVQRRPPDVAGAVTTYRQALAIADALEMRPLAARCHLGLGATLAVTPGEAREAHAHLARAREIFAALGIDRWRREADALSTQPTD